MRKWILGVSVLAALSLPLWATAASLPDATQKALSELKLDPSVMNGLDDDLRVPQAWVDQAAVEKRVIILGTWYDNQFRAMTAPFRERYPGVSLDFRRTGTAARGMRVLVALNEGRVTADVLTSIVDAGPEFVKAKALADLRDIPGTKNLPPEYIDGNGMWAAYARSYRCMAYNTTKVKPEDLPKTWDDLLTNPRWRGGKLALSNHPNTWLLHLWSSLGEQWGEDFTRRLFETVQPQRRSEGLSAVTTLTVAGEADANIPAPERRVSTLVRQNAPVGFHCAEPVPVTLSQIVMLEKSPHKNASRLFINWLLSREGQLMQYTEAYAVPVHNGLQSAAFIPFADTIVGKKVSIRDESMMNDALQEKMMKVWNSYWTGQ
ncbi:MAG TPA: extracellular solute-binding protein [Alphaproteobacteria bacterium]|nr:extracellular solute-binding protein [Alphaproteobacteria bacterium]